MRVDIGDIRLFVDVEGPKLVPGGPDMVERSVMNRDMLGHFFGPDGEGHCFDFLPDLDVRIGISRKVIVSSLVTNCG